MKTNKTGRMDIAGEKYNSLTALRFYDNDKHNNSVWECLCDCGEVSYVRLGALRAGQIKQCSKCSTKEKKKYFIDNIRIKNIFTDMKRRCYSPSRNNYFRYGGRGIKICDEWLGNPSAFEEWSIKNGYQDYLTIDRIDNDGNYEPSNCRWTDYKVQANNRSNNRILEYQGESLSVEEWAVKLSVDKTTLYNRLKNGEHKNAVFSSIDIRQQKSKSGIKGISWSNRANRWKLRFRENGKRIFIGTYKSIDNAMFAKDKYESEKIVLKEKEVEEILRQIDQAK